MSKEAPHILDSEHDPRILRALAKMLDEENKRLLAALEKAQAEQTKNQQTKINLEESLMVLRKDIYGRSSEKSPGDRRRDRMNENPELLLHSQNVLPPPKNKAVRNLESEEQVHSATDEDLKSMSEAFEINNPSSSQWEEIPGLFDQSTEIQVIERSYKKIIHKKKKYRLKKEHALAEKEVIVTAPGPVKFVAGSSYSTEFVVSVVVDKYLNHLPLERQCRMMESLGLSGMHTQVLYNLTMLASDYLLPVVERIKNKILQHGLVHSDETPWPITNGKDSDGYLWIVSNNYGSFYRFEPTRSGKVIKETLEGFSGTVMTDGYSGYYQFKDSVNYKWVMCHAHARRNFWKIKDTNPQVQVILDLWEELFRLEHQGRTLEELRKIRKEKSKVVVDQMQEWLMAEWPEARPESEMRKAIQYCTKHWQELTKFLEDPLVPLTNNEAERTIRQAVMGRKNFYGSRSINGADVTAILYTVIESCKKVELDPREYLLTTLKLAAADNATETPFEMAQRLRQ